MKLLLALLLLAVVGATGVDEPTDGPFAWLTGCWRSADSSSQEVWVADHDGSLVGFAITIRSNAIGFYEIMSIRQVRDVGWTFTAHPSGQASASFEAVAISANSVVFTNPDHDYPQEIRYQRDDASLLSSISLLNNKQARLFNKVACASS